MHPEVTKLGRELLNLADRALLRKVLLAKLFFGSRLMAKLNYATARTSRLGAFDSVLNDHASGTSVVRPDTPQTDSLRKNESTEQISAALRYTVAVKVPAD